MSPELMLAILQTIRLGAELIELSQSDEFTQEELRAKWDEIVSRVKTANELWEWSGGLR